MTAHLAEAWTGFFSAAAGAAATLAGLVIVAVSVNVQRILEHRHLPSRAGATIGALVLILISSMAALMPQPLGTLAVEILVFGLAVWLFDLWSIRQVVLAQREAPRPLHEAVISIGAGQIQVLPFLVGGALLLGGHGVGAYWIAAGIIATFIFSVLSAWVFLVEILR